MPWTGGAVRPERPIDLAREIHNNPRAVAYQLLLAVASEDAYANLLLPKLLNNAKLDSRDAGFAQELAFGTIRNSMFYDAAIAVAADRPIESIDAEARSLLQLGAHQLLGMRVPSHAALSETVDLAKKVLRPGLSGFVNAILRRISERNRDEWLELLEGRAKNNWEKLAIRYSHPEWMVRALADALRVDGREADLELLLSTDNRAPLVSLVALPGLANEDDLLDVGAVIAGVSPIGAELPDGDPAMLEPVRNGRIRVQDQGSQLAALALLEAPLGENADPKRKEEWLDLCAGPGGKAALLAAEARIRGAELVCNELQPHRAKLVEQALSRVNPDVYVRTGDGRELGDDAPEAFDRILLDAPCTGLGALRRRPESRYRRQLTDVAQLTKLQRELFASAWAGLRPGGVLAYVTCSPHPAETTAVVDWAQKQHGDKLELLDATAILRRVSPGLATNEAIAITDGRKTVQLWPHRQTTDAMFIALMRKAN
jgi:16S rRNA (cytosine967-C5)-methyltransferase